MVLDTTLSEECVLLVINHARVAKTTQLNVLLVPMDTSTPTEDVSHHAQLDSSLTQPQSHARPALQLVPLAALLTTVSLVQMIRSFQ